MPEPIAPIDVTFVSLEPTRISMSLPLITSSGPMFIDSIAFVSPASFVGAGDAAGIGIPGVCRCGCGMDGEALGVAAGVGAGVGFGS